jgi:hypothetical protein
MECLETPNGAQRLQRRGHLVWKIRPIEYPRKTCPEIEHNGADGFRDFWRR